MIRGRNHFASRAQVLIACLLATDSSSSKLPVVKRTMEAFEKGFPLVGCIRIPSGVWECYPPQRLEFVGIMQCKKIRRAWRVGCVMLKALVRQGIMHACPGTDLGPNRSLCPILKWSEKARELREQPLRLVLPSIEVVALIILLEVCDSTSYRYKV